MQQELGERAAILGVNAIGYESSNEAFTVGISLPWLQDVDQVEAWDLWGAEWRDVWVLDTANQLAHVYSLNEHDLGIEADYLELMALIEEAGG